MKSLREIFSRRPAPALAEPSWGEVLANVDEQRAAASYWRDVTVAMRARGTIEPVNGPAVLRLVIAYLVADRASAEVLRSSGEHAWRVFLDASQLASTIESDLGLLPLSRDRVRRG
jgi:hypothetical protein